MPELRIKNITRTYGAEKAVDDFSLTVRGGEMLTILGPSGCGKSTLLSCVAGIQSPDQGEIFLDDRCLFSSERGIRVPPEERNIGFVFQNYALWPHMTVERNISYPLRIRRKKASEIKNSVRRVLALMKLDELGGRYPRQLSGGEQQRVALGRALIMNPDILVLDEPLSSLDARLREGMQEEIRKLQRELRLTILNVTHDQTEALTLSNRIAIMNHGRLVQEGSPEELYENPACPFSAEFLGMNNFLAPGSSALSACPRFDHANMRSLGFSMDAQLVSIRPEDIELSALPPEGAAPARKAVIVDRVFKGSLLQYTIQNESVTLKTQTAKSQNFSIGQEIAFSIKHGVILKPSLKCPAHQNRA